MDMKPNRAIQSLTDNDGMQRIDTTKPDLRRNNGGARTGTGPKLRDGLKNKPYAASIHPNDYARLMKHYKTTTLTEVVKIILKNIE